MSKARSGSDWARKAPSTSYAVNPGLSFSSHVSNCFSSGVLVLRSDICGGGGEDDGDGGDTVVVGFKGSLAAAAEIDRR